jgi:hypothetical protein
VARTCAAAAAASASAASAAAVAPSLSTRPIKISKGVFEILYTTNCHELIKGV